MHANTALLLDGHCEHQKFNVLKFTTPNIIIPYLGLSVIENILT